VVDEHADAGDQPEQAAVLIGFDLRRAKKGIKHVQASLAAENGRMIENDATKIIAFCPKVKRANKNAPL